MLGYTFLFLFQMFCPYKQWFQFVLGKDIIIFTQKWFLAPCQWGLVLHLEYIYGNAVVQ